MPRTVSGGSRSSGREGMQFASSNKGTGSKTMSKGNKTTVSSGTGRSTAKSSSSQTQKAVARGETAGQERSEGKLAKPSSPSGAGAGSAANTKGQISGRGKTKGTPAKGGR